MRQRVNTDAWSSWVTLARTSDNITSATKATQDSRGQQIDTTYVKGVTGSNATLTITKGNGTTSQVTINNVANATAASKVVQGTQYYLQSGNGDVDENTVISQNKANVVLGSWYSTGFRDLCSSGTPITVAINHRNGNIKTKGSVTASGGFKGNADTATKASQDSDGNAINTTYLKRSGGTMGGALNLANNTLNLAGDNCYFGDQDIAGGFCLKGANGTTNLTFINKDNTTQMASLSYAGVEIISSVNIKVPKIVFSNGFGIMDRVG